MKGTALLVLAGLLVAILGVVLVANREAPAAYWRIPCADHYLQVDVYELIVGVLRATLAGDPVPSEIDGPNWQAVRVH
jgi:hypothetical protein